MSAKQRVHLIAAARPNFMKIAPLYHQLKKEEWCDVQVVHTGQHYDPNMSDAFSAICACPGLISTSRSAVAPTRSRRAAS